MGNLQSIPAWRRVLIGDAPWAFLAETLLRAVIVYVVLLAAIRLLGKRVAGQWSASELAVIVTLGAAVGVPMQAPDRGMLPALIVLAVAIVYERGIGRLSFERRRVEIVTQGDLSVLVCDGCIDLSEMKRCGLSRERLFSVLRAKGIEQLGEVERVYLEADGAFSVYRRRDAAPGLTAFPGSDASMLERQQVANGTVACASCGNVATRRENTPCDACGAQRWTGAVCGRTQQSRAS